MKFPPELNRKVEQEGMNIKAIKAVFRLTVPVLIGYLAIGIAFGLLLNAAGYNVLWALFMSVTVYAGSGQYMGAEFLTTGEALTQVALLTFLLNFRHLVYGLSMLEKFRGMGGRKVYMIFALTDETYALLSSAEPPIGVDRRDFYFYISLLNQLYWIAGSVIGSVAGALLSFSIQGIEFAMTALFVVIAVEQWKAYPRHLSAMIGGACTLISLAIFGAENMLLPALGVIVVLLLALRARLEDREEVTE